MNENRNIDSLRHYKSNKVTTSYKRSYGRVGIKKIRIGRKVGFFVPIVFIIISISLVYLSIFQTKIYQIAFLIEKMKNQSILIGFQNSAELRPTGGFWGSFAILDIRSDILDSTIYFDTNPYKQDNELLKESDTELPDPMKQLWKGRPQSFVNANWPASFPESAKTLQWYFGQGWGDKSVSGVIALSSLSLIDLLEITGPVSLSDGTEVNNNNFTQIMSEKIDSEYWLDEKNKSINEPKTIIKELFPKIIDKTKNLPRIKIYKFLTDQMSRGRILAYFNNKKLNLTVKKLKISGDLLPYKADYLSVNNANISGNKSSLNIIQHVNYQVENLDGKFLSALSLTRSHIDRWPHSQNTNYTRVFTPLGSQLKSAKLGSDDITNSLSIQQESGRTVFGFWFNTDCGQQKTAFIEYYLPQEIPNGKYSLTYQKQNGTLADWLNINVSDKILFAGEFDKTSQVFLYREN